MTSRLVAAAREAESKRSDRLFDDPYAGSLAGDEGRAMLKMLHELGRPAGAPETIPENPHLAFRTRFFDDTLQHVAQEGCLQIVLLAAGMDTRAFRLDWPEGTSIFEVERPDILEYKKTVLNGLNPTPRAKRVVVEMDLRDDFMGALRSSGLSNSAATVFTIEGLLPYLPDQASVKRLFSLIADGAAPGSQLGFDTVSETFLHSPWTKPFVEAMAAKGIEWHFGMEKPEDLLEACGFVDAKVVEPSELQYRQWPYPHIPRSIPGVPRWFLVTARTRGLS
jgi:methyltransferase (TIGR00027 family)